MFSFEEFTNSPPIGKQAIDDKHTIRENASGYNTAIVKLLNQLGIIP